MAVLSSDVNLSNAASPSNARLRSSVRHLLPHVTKLTALAVIGLLLFSSCGPPPGWVEGSQRGATLPGDAIEVMSLNADRDSTVEYEAFHFLSTETDVDSSMRVGRVRATVRSDETPLNEVIRGLARRANDLSANAFQVREAAYRQDTSLVVDLNLFAVSDSLLERNESHFPTNRIYIIGALNPDGDAEDFKLNGEDATVRPLRYIAIDNEVGGETTISIGGLLGAELTLQGRENRPASYWSLSDFGVGPYLGGPGPARPPGMGVSFNTGRIHPIAPDAGRFFVRVLQEQDAR